jgi:hypothetical protein
MKLGGDPIPEDFCSFRGRSKKFFLIFKAIMRHMFGKNVAYSRPVSGG